MVLPEAQQCPLGTSLPQGDEHAISASFPTWQNLVDYMADDQAVVNSLESYYPRFYQHARVQRLNNAVLSRVQAVGARCLIFQSQQAAARCRHYFYQQNLFTTGLRELTFTPSWEASEVDRRWTTFTAVLYPEEYKASAGEFWGDMGDGVSSRHAQHLLAVFSYLSMEPMAEDTAPGRPRIATKLGDRGRLTKHNADTSIKQDLRQSIAGCVTSEHPWQPAVSPEDVYLYPKGMCAIQAAALALIPATSRNSEAVVFGWPYGSTPRCVRASGFDRFTFYHKGIAAELDLLEASLSLGNRIACLFCEIPSNPLCSTPDLHRIRALADRFHFAVVCDETIGTFVNVDVLPFVDIVVTSLTKSFSGACNVMAGSLVLNALSQYYSQLKSYFTANHTDLLFPMDALVLQQNSLDFRARVVQTNATALALVETLEPYRPRLLLDLNYPTTVPSGRLYERYIRQGDLAGGYGSVFSIVFNHPGTAISFYDALELCKGPSIGANFSLALPYAQLAHAYELDWAEEKGIARHIIRISVGLEKCELLVGKLRRALDVAERHEKDLQAVDEPAHKVQDL